MKKVVLITFASAFLAGTVVFLGSCMDRQPGPVCPVPCLYDTCERESGCPTRPVWKKAAEALETMFAETTIAQMAEQPACENGASVTYQI